METSGNPRSRSNHRRHLSPRRKSIFWDASNAASIDVVELRDDDYDQLVIKVNDPDAVVAVRSQTDDYFRINVGRRSTYVGLMKVRVVSTYRELIDLPIVAKLNKSLSNHLC
jgi:hypothetical protein